MNSAPAIEVSHLIKQYNGLKAVDDISFEVRTGELFGFVGPNGAGKTTTLHILCTLLAPTSGQARVAGWSCLKEAMRVREQIGIIFQDPSLDERLTAWENLEFHGMIYHMPKPLRRQRTEELLQWVGLWDRRRSVVRTFSGGMKRRLEVARGLMHRPKVLFLDEPTLGLDPQTRYRIWEMLQSLKSNDGVTSLITTHSMEEAQRCDRVSILDHGKLVALGTPGELIAQQKVRNLEEVFLGVTGHDLRDNGASGSEISRGKIRKMRSWA